ncbi:MAG TPA: S41 family peptidase, partial [Phototrophicaceae bacterium]|nr:S41 family peptidase [Phototrophicaceae bacterium]
DDELANIDAKNLNGLIIDLRGNPGGYLGSAIEIASAFQKDGVVLYEQFGDGTEQTFNTDGSYDGIEIPLVVLVDERSASASELVSGAWQDNGVAKLIGVTTFGKGTVQTQNDLVNGGGLRLTIAHWLTPKHNWIHKQGITPDIVVEWAAEDRQTNPDQDPQLQAALDYLKELTPAVSQ